MFLFDIARAEKRAAELEALMGQPGFWDSPEGSRRVVAELGQLREITDTYRVLGKRIDGAALLLELAKEEGDHKLIPEIAQEIKSVRRDLEEFETRGMLAGKYDANNAIVSLHAGAGGTEAQDWVAMLLRMYLRWCENKGFQTRVTNALPGEEAGLKSVTLIAEGRNAYGLLKAEKGVHRLVRISPFDASHRRHTSFASVDVIPEIDATIEVEINPEELRLDTFRSSGAGGQHVNKTDSAVRITHLPTGIVVECQNERSQHSNRLTAMKILRARLFALRRREREKEVAELRGEQHEIAWGSQIRSYVFQPYSLVKDHRTDIEVGNVQAVMDGDIDMFVYGYLKQESRRARGAASC